MARARRRIAVLVGAAALAVGAVAGSAVPASARPARPAASTPAPSPTATLAPRPVGAALAVDVTGGTVLTLPAKDGLRDTTTVLVRSGLRGLVDVDAVAGKKVVHLGTRLALRTAKQGWSRTVAVDVRHLKAGSWRIRAARSTGATVRATSKPLLVGTGAPVHVAVHPAVRTLYPFTDGVLDSVAVTVTATDETGLAVPLNGRVRIDAGRHHVTRGLSRAGVARLPITGLPLGPATATATVAGPSGDATRRTALNFAPTAVGALRIARSSDTVQPVADGLLDSVVLTTSGTASAGSPATVRGTLTVSRTVKGVTTTAATFTIPNGAPHAFTWDGRVNHVIVPGTWTATLALHGPQGEVRTRTATILVTKQHLPYRVQDLFTVAAGNQQGLAVRNGTFYVGYDDGNGQAEIQQYDGGGAHTATLGPLAIGHVAELSYSTTTGLLYAANGGATNPTSVWAIDPVWTDQILADPASAVRQTYDLSALGNNGMVAVDDAHAHLLVFAGTAPNYTVTPVSLTDVTTTNPDGTSTTVPAGTVGTPVPIAITGTPQGMEVVGSQLWVYTSLKKANHLAKYELTTAALAAGVDGSSDLENPGEGEGLAIDLPTGTIYVGAHSANRVGQLVPVADE